MPVNQVPSTFDKRLNKRLCLKYGSLQEFVKCDDVSGNFSPDLFSADEVHKIGILDLRLLNLDRNDGNILVQKRVIESKKSKKKRTEYFM